MAAQDVQAPAPKHGSSMKKNKAAERSESPALSAMATPVDKAVSVDGGNDGDSQHTRELAK